MLCLTEGKDYKVCWDEQQLKELVDASVYQGNVYNMQEEDDTYTYEVTVSLPVKLVFPKGSVKPVVNCRGRVKPSAIVMHNMQFYCWKSIADNVDRVFDLTLNPGSGRVQCVSPGYGDMGSYTNYGNGPLFVSINDIIFEED